MVDERVKSVGGYLMRLGGGVLVILGILGAFTALSQGNLIGIIISVAFVVGGAFLFKRSSGTRRARESASVSRG
ncbi:hypothetical protein [Virgisporangium aurantiacum]|uniref:Uncharacterized protein n=1 Tax=Virgisporangium aurantiacum TaxID=175570 RepID=A0A8J3ZGJ2_9ACTN|nr:hypothetical protein [Virgisporangium aurantiacum]GIJ63509.1 hypothetical protein Vau01_110250 [Virgisporangium aurantiacum]